MSRNQHRLTDADWLHYLLQQAKQAGINPTSYLARVKRNADYCQSLWCWNAQYNHKASRCQEHLRTNQEERQRYVTRKRR